MRSVGARNDQRRNVETQQIFRFGAGRRIAIEQRARHAGYDSLVMVEVEPPHIGRQNRDSCG